MLHQFFVRSGSAAWWLQGTYANERVHADGIEVSTQLLRALAKEAAQAGVSFSCVLLPSGPPSSSDAPTSDPAQSVVEQLGAGVRLLDLRRAHAALPTATGARHFVVHMTAEGNAWVAEQLAAWFTPR